MSLRWDPKDPDEEVDYQVDWSGRLDEGDTIAASAFTVPTGLTQPKPATFSDTTTTVWLGSGAAGTTYTILNRVTTAGGRIYDQSVKIRIKER